MRSHYYYINDMEMELVIGGKSAAGSRLPVLHPAGKIGSQHGSGDEIALGKITAGAAQEIPVGPVFDPFGHDLNAQLSCQTQTGVVHRPQCLIGPSAVYEALVDLEFVEGKVAQLGQGRMPGAEIIDR